MIKKGADLNNALAFVDKGLTEEHKNKIINEYDLNSDIFKKVIINNTKLRFKNEAVRHKILD